MMNLAMKFIQTRNASAMMIRGHSIMLVLRMPYHDYIMHSYLLNSHLLVHRQEGNHVLCVSVLRVLVS